MSVDSKHPLYFEFEPDWIQMRDTFRGERIVKEKGFEYLPPTEGMIEDGALAATATSETRGMRAYNAYRKRAVCPEFVSEGVEAMLGVMHNKPPKIELPAALEPLRERATLHNESLEMLLRRINEEQLISGRLGLLLDVPEAIGPTLPYIAMYRAEDMINWDEGERDKLEVDALNLVVMDESEPERVDGFEWREVRKFRALILGDPIANEAENSGARFSVAIFRENEGGGLNFGDAELVTPKIAGKVLEEIPFKFINTKDITPNPDDAPLLGLSNLQLTVYRGEADYRQSLFLQGQDTLVEIGNNAEGDDDRATRIGAGAKLSLPTGGDAKFIGVDSSGLPEQRLALENDYDRASSKSSALLDDTKKSAESGDALRIRVSARTSSLNQIAETGAFGLQELLRIAARWVGADPSQVVVRPNLDFADDLMSGQELTGIMTAKGLGAPLSQQQIHRVQFERGLTELTFEEELAQMQKEAEEGLPGAIMPGEGDEQGSTADDGPVTDDDVNEDDENEDEGNDE